MKNTAVILTLALGMCGVVSKAAADTFWKEVRGWRIAHSDEYVGCVASAKYRDGTLVRIGFDGIIRKPFLNFSNSKWSSYPTGRTYEITFDTGRSGRFAGFFHTLLREGVLTFENGGLNDKFLDAVAGAASLNVRSENTLLTGLVLDGSRAALNETQVCQSQFQ
jgi:hypothetical protein